VTPPANDAAITPQDAGVAAVPPKRNRSRLIWYGLAALGPIAAAGSQFVLSFQLLHAIGQAEFGAFSFLLVLSQLSFSVSSALLCAPLPALLAAASSEGERDRVVQQLLACNLAMGVVSFGLFLAAAMLLGLPQQAAWVFAGSAGVMLMRWFGRAYGYATGAQWRAIASDLTYSLVLLAGVGMMALLTTPSLNVAYASLLVAALASMIPFGRRFLGGLFLRFSLKDLSGYRSTWRTYSRWSLAGVVTTEATVNSHSYIVTALAGAAAFSPLAASALLTRPLQLAMNALTDFERPQMAKQLAGGGKDGVFRSGRQFRMALIAVWAVSAVLALGLFALAPGLIFPDTYNLVDLMLASALWFVIAAARLMRTPESTILQAAGEFRSLASASYVSSIVSVVAVLILVLVAGPLWSLVGIALGECLFAVLIWRQTLRWKRQKPEGKATAR
jgi:hypothetical protein